MTKPPHTSCMKEQKILIWNNFLLEKVEHDGKIGHLFVADISFTEKQATAKQMYNEIYCSIFEKQKIIGESERSNFQHLESLT